MPVINGIRTPIGTLYDPNPIQQAFHASPAPYRLYAGGFGSGKTLALCVEVFLFTQEYPGSIGLLCRKAHTHLVGTTWQTLLDIIPPGYLDESKCNKNEFKLAFKNSSIIYGLNLQNEENIRSRNAHFWAVDEICELEDERMFLEIVGRCRLPGAPNVGWACGNPGGHNWVYDRWHIADWEAGKPSRDPDFSYHHAKTSDNKFNSEDYEARLRKLYPSDMVRQLLDGSWSVFEGQALSQYNPAVHILDYDDLAKLTSNPAWETYPCYRAIDHGWNDDTRCLWAKVDGDGNIFVFDEYSSHHKVISDMGREIRERHPELPIVRTAIDKSTKQTNAQSGEDDYTHWHAALEFEALEPSDSRQGPSVLTLQELLRIDPKHRHPITGELGSPHLFISPYCTHLRREIPLCRWKGFGAAQAFSPTLVDGNDHSVSALRYLVQMKPAGAGQAVEISDFERMQARWEKERAPRGGDYHADVIGPEWD